MAGDYGSGKYGSGNFGSLFGDSSARTYGDGHYGQGDYGPNFGAGAYPQLVLSHPDLSVYYRLGESVGTTLVDSGPNGLNGTYAGSGVTYGAADALVNDPDTAVTFLATVDNPASRTDDNALDLGDGPFSLELWIKRDTTGTAQRLLDKGASGGYSVAISNTNGIVFQAFGVGVFAFSTTTITDTTTWHHIVCTKNGSARKIWIDAVDVTGLLTDVTLTDNSASLLVGGFSTSKFAGSMDELALYKGAVLTADEVLQHYRTGVGEIRLTETITPSDAQVKASQVAIADSVSPSESTVKAPEVAEADSVTVADVNAKDITTVTTDSVTATDADGKDITTVAADSVTATDTQSSEPGVYQDDSVTASDAVSSEVGLGLVLDDPVTLTDDEAIETGVEANLADSVTATDDQAIDVGLNLSEIASLTDALATEDAIVIGDSVTLSDDVAPDIVEDLTQSVDDFVSLSDYLTTHLETEGGGVVQQPSFGGVVRVPVVVRDLRVGLADLIVVTDDHEAQLAKHLTDKQREQELLALV